MKYLLLASALFMSANVFANPVCQNPGVSDPDGDGWGWENGASCRVVDNTGGNAAVSTESDIQAQLNALALRVQALEAKVNSSNGSTNNSNNNTPTNTGGGYYNDTPNCPTAVARINANAHQLIGKNQQQVQAWIGKPQEVDSSSSGTTVIVVWDYSNNGTWNRPSITFQNGFVRRFDSDFYPSYCY